MNSSSQPAANSTFEAALRQHQENIKSRRLTGRDYALGATILLAVAVGGNALMSAIGYKPISGSSSLIASSLKRECDGTIVQTPNGTMLTEKNRHKAIPVGNQWLYELFDPAKFEGCKDATVVARPQVYPPTQTDPSFDPRPGFRALGPLATSRTVDRVRHFSPARTKTGHRLTPSAYRSG